MNQANMNQAVIRAVAIRVVVVLSCRAPIALVTGGYRR